MILRPGIAYLLAGLALWVALALPHHRVMLESRLATHMLVQIPLLVLAGYLVGVWLRRPTSRWLDSCNKHGATGLALLIPAATLWMLPRWIDASIDSGLVEFGKFTSLPLLVGLPLAVSVPRIGAMTAGFLKAQIVSMALVQGWLYLAAPVRLCNNYLIDDQALLGIVWLLVAAGLAVVWSVPVFLTDPNITGGGRAVPSRKQGDRHVVQFHAG